MTKTACILTAGLLSFASIVQAEVTIKESEGEYAIQIDGEPFTVYKHKDLRNPCFYPVHGPHGLPMTRRYPLEDAAEGEAKDHPHHTSLWYTHGDVNGLDFWHGGGNNPERGGKVMHEEVVTMEDGEDRGILVTKSKWLTAVGDKEVCQDERRFAFGKIGESRYIDFQITIKATNGDVVFGDTKEGSMSIRTHPNLRLQGEVANGKAANSAGDKDKDLWGKEAKWVDYWGKIDDKEVGVAIFDHPSNPRHPTTWHAREYGLIAANPFGYSSFFKGQEKDGKLVVKDGEEITFRYGFLFHPGGHNAERLEEVFQIFAQDKAE